MKKLIFTMFILCVFSVFCMAQDVQPQNNGEQKRPQMRQRQGRGQGKGQNRGQQRRTAGAVFGISQKNYTGLNLTAEQQTKAGELQKAFNEKYQIKMPQPEKPKSNTGSSAKKNNTEELQKQHEQMLKMQADMLKIQAERAKAEPQLFADFRNILTDEQKTAYDKARNEYIDSLKKMLSKQNEQYDSVVKFTDEQKDKIKKLIDAFNGNMFDYNTEFNKIVTQDQIKAYGVYQQEQMQKMMQNRPQTGQGFRPQRGEGGQQWGQRGQGGQHGQRSQRGQRGQRDQNNPEDSEMETLPEE